MEKKTRFLVLSCGILLIFGVTLVRLVQTTLFPDKRLSTVNVHSSIPRGNIYDIKGRLISGVSATGSFFVRPDSLSLELREYLKSYLLSTGYFTSQDVEKIDLTDKHFMYIKRDMTPSILAPVELVIKTLKEEGHITNDELGIEIEESRFYPYPFLSPIVGFLGRDGVGLYGIEYTLNDALSQGLNATLTLDADISRIAYEELYRAVNESDANSGSVAIMDIKTRNILALVQVGNREHTPSSISDIYEPGSVMKLFTAAFAMEQGLASTESPKFDDYTPFKIGGHTFSRPALGYIPLSTMLTKSANISFARLASQFGSDDYYLWLTELGFGKKPNLPLTSLEKGILHPPSAWSPLSKPMLGLGQEIGVTTLQLLIAASVIGSGGIYKDPTLLLSLKNKENVETLTNLPPMEEKILFHPLKAKELLYAMENVVSAQGTGRGAQIEGVRIAGKTGTGMIAGEEGYSEGRNNTVFIGILPVDDPSLVMVVSLHNPRGRFRSGGGVSAPLFADITRRILLSTGYSLKQEY